MDQISDYLPTASGVFLLSAWASYRAYLRRCEPKRNYLRKISMNKSYDWLNEEEFQTLAAICDTYLPSYSINDLSEEKIKSTLITLNADTLPEDTIFTIEKVAKNRKLLSIGALEVGVHRHLAEAVECLICKSEKKELSLLLKLLGSSAGNFLLTGYPLPFQELPISSRVKIVQSFRESLINDFRKVFLLFRRLIGLSFFSFAEIGHANPVWDELGYLPTSAVRSFDNYPHSEHEKKDRKLKSLFRYSKVFDDIKGIEDNEYDELSIDVVVIGSGCGGGVVAHQLILAGYNVLVLEKGGYYNSADFSRWRESEAMTNTLEKGGLCTTKDGNILILAGSCLGGGSTINWCASFQTPKFILKEWADQGLDDFGPGGKYEQSEKEVLKLFNVNSDYSFYPKEDEGKHSFKVNENNRLLWKGAEKIGYKPESIPRNVKKCVDCGHCCFGCSHESKQSTIFTLLEPLLLDQHSESPTPGRGKLYIIADCEVNKILFSKDSNGVKSAHGVEATVSMYSDEPKITHTRILINKKKIMVKAKIVVCSAGSIHSPALLIRSGFTHPKIGRGLTLHPVIGVGGIFPEDVKTELSNGVSMGVVIKNPPIFANSSDPSSDEKSHPVALETPPIHPGIWGAVLPWANGLSYKVLALAWKNTATFLGISRDRSNMTNRVTVDSEGHPVIEYEIEPKDFPMLLAGVEANIRSMRAAGAKAVFITHTAHPWYVVDSDPSKDAESFDKYIREMHKIDTRPNRLTVFSAHQMSSCRMAKDSHTGPVSQTGELFECSNLYVADGSVFPTSLGINPMITIDGIAHMIAHRIIERLQTKSK